MSKKGGTEKTYPDLSSRITVSDYRMSPTKVKEYFVFCYFNSQLKILKYYNDRIY